VSGLNIAKTIIIKRKEKGITQEELASFFGVSKSSISKWETGQSFPDIVFLPQLASYFNITLDELLGYEPQMMFGDIRKLIKELIDDFSEKPFEETMERCREITKRYFSCFSLLYQLGMFFMNCSHALDDAEEKKMVLTEAKELFVRVKTLCGDIELSQFALNSEALCEMLLGDPNSVVALLENAQKYTFQPSVGVMLSESYKKLGKTKKAKTALQDNILDNVLSLLYTMPFYLSICTDENKNTEHIEEICRRTIAMIDLFNVKEISLANVLLCYASVAKAYLKIGNEEKALSTLEAYVDAASGNILSLVWVKGDDFFTLIDEYQEDQANESPVATPEIHREEQAYKQECVNRILLDPAFSELHENQRFQRLAQRLKEIL